MSFVLGYYLLRVCAFATESHAHYEVVTFDISRCDHANSISQS